MAEENSRSEERRLKEISAMLARVRVLPRGRIYMGLREGGYSCEQANQILEVVMPVFESEQAEAASAAHERWKAIFAVAYGASMILIIIGVALF